MIDGAGIFDAQALVGGRHTHLNSHFFVFYKKFDENQGCKASHQTCLQAEGGIIRSSRASPLPRPATASVRFLSKRAMP